MIFFLQNMVNNVENGRIARIVSEPVSAGAVPGAVPASEASGAAEPWPAAGYRAASGASGAAEPDAGEGEPDAAGASEESGLPSRSYRRVPWARRHTTTWLVILDDGVPVGVPYAICWVEHGGGSGRLGPPGPRSLNVYDRLDEWRQMAEKLRCPSFFFWVTYLSIGFMKIFHENNIILVIVWKNIYVADYK